MVTVSSNAHKTVRGIAFDNLNGDRRYFRWNAYGQSKLANLMFGYELQRRLAGHGTTIAVAAHPGLSDTELTRNSPAVLRALNPLIAPLTSQKPDKGALPTLRAATDPGAEGGTYWGPHGCFGMNGPPAPAKTAKRARDEKMAAELFDRSEQLSGVSFGRLHRTSEAA